MWNLPFCTRDGWRLMALREGLVKGMRIALPSGRWKAHAESLMDIDYPAVRTALRFRGVGSRTLRMYATHIGDVHLAGIPPGELRAFARSGVFEREERIEGSAWTFWTTRPPPALIIGLDSDYQPPSLVHFRSAVGEHGFGELPLGCSLADATHDELAALLRPGRRRGGTGTPGLAA